jgi:sugar diacid utilization regulator
MDEVPLLLVPTEGATDALEAQLRAALARLPGPEAVIAGVGADVAALPAAGPACRQARDEVEIGRRLPMGDPVVRFADVAADVLLLRSPDIAALLAGRLAPLATRPELLQTLRTYLECGMSARETARRLYLHPNTVPYRLKVVEQLLGRGLSTVASDPVTVLGLRALAMAAAP